MQFFVPHAKDNVQAQTVWESVRENLHQQGLPTTSRRVWKLAFRHNGKPYSLEVGKLHPDLHEDVVIILRAATHNLYYVCTASRGVLRGEPYLVGVNDDTSAVDFEPSPDG